MDQSNQCLQRPDHFLKDREVYTQLISSSNDGWVNEPDYFVLSNCFTGPGGTVADGLCEAGDFDGDGDIDSSDWDEFVIAWQGAGPAPGAPVPTLLPLARLLLIPVMLAAAVWARRRA